MTGNHGTGINFQGRHMRVYWSGGGLVWIATTSGYFNKNGTITYVAAGATIAQVTGGGGKNYSVIYSPKDN